jgi:hypothetical protein
MRPGLRGLVVTHQQLPVFGLTKQRQFGNALFRSGDNTCQQCLVVSGYALNGCGFEQVSVVMQQAFHPGRRLRQDQGQIEFRGAGLDRKWPHLRGAELKV